MKIEQLCDVIISDTSKIEIMRSGLGTIIKLDN